jgi:ABC-type polysaccharide/polyol phosphate export permease
MAAAAALALRPVRRLRVIAAHRQLLLELMHRDFDNRYAGSVLGVMWTQLYPLMLLIVYSFVFSVIFTNAIPNFPVFLFVGIAIWNFFSTAILLATSSVLANANLVTKVGFPRELVTISVVLVAFIDLAASHLVLLIGAFVFNVSPAMSWFAMVPLIVLLTVFCIGLGLMLASAAVYLRDVRFFVEVGVLLLMFLTPVFYSHSAVPESLWWVLDTNPIAVAILAYRSAFLDGMWPDLSSWARLVVASGVALWLGIETFDRAQRGFPDAL